MSDKNSCLSGSVIYQQSDVQLGHVIAKCDTLQERAAARASESAPVLITSN